VNSRFFTGGFVRIHNLQVALRPLPSLWHLSACGSWNLDKDGLPEFNKQNMTAYTFTSLLVLVPYRFGGISKEEMIDNHSIFL